MKSYNQNHSLSGWNMTAPVPVFEEEEELPLRIVTKGSNCKFADNGGCSMESKQEFSETPQQGAAHHGKVTISFINRKHPAYNWYNWQRRIRLA